ncbi:nicotinamide mononucleotide transporter [Companilactobacillus sp. RD055328]|uniref:nicotinamide riboside transporter PnuC n=1 Tax=Companilactobacillus sp. RD055328 TaxID=2916634 RepID=UPI001FC87893|nr:nicotinamide riboside transporter PnuC [Companilactobacillus sp. RD055328]GKQ42627.1 nicotinamide mononucleotide transporter [Companilactobacillus sp. RD055328]
MQNSNKGYDEMAITRVFNWRWYKDQMSGWTRSSYILLTVGILFQLIIGLSHGITGLGVTSTIAGIIGFSCTVSITNGRPINGILGFISALMLIYVALVTGNYSDIIMQGAYIILLDIPILLQKQWSNHDPRKMNGKDIIQTAIIFAIFLAATYILDTVILDSPQAILDAVSATIGLTGAVLTVRRFRSSYYFWTAQGVMSVALWIQTAMNGHPVWVLMFTYMLYLANDIVAFSDSKWFAKKK